MAFIQAYTFGSIQISGRAYDSDLIILPDQTILENWRRQSGHHLIQEDILPLLACDLNEIIVGTGAYGRMTVDPVLKKRLKGSDIQVHSLETKKAVALFNRRIDSNDSIGACFHLTC